MSQNRRRERRFAFQIIYAMSFERTVSTATLAGSFDNFWDEEGFTGEPRSSFAWTLVEGVSCHLTHLDEIVARYSQHWKIGRIARVDLTILRLALYEMLFCPDIPGKVSMNEAIELAKDFGDDNSKVFINGVLDAAGKEMEKS